MQPRLHGTDGGTDDLGDLRERKPGVVVQDEDRAMLRRQPHEGAIECVTVVDRDRRIGSARSVDRQDPDVGAPAPIPTQLLVTGIDEQPMEPGTEAFRITEPWEFPPCEEECLLDGVLRSFRIANDPVGDRLAKVTVEVEEFGEGDIVTVPRPFDQPRPHERYSSGARWGASPQQMVTFRERFTCAPTLDVRLCLERWNNPARGGPRLDECGRMAAMIKADRCNVTWWFGHNAAISTPFRG